MVDDMIMAAHLWDELDRLIERYIDEPVAVEALEAVKWWLQEETVEDAEDEVEDAEDEVEDDTGYLADMDFLSV